jgi:hypothetical protein
MYKKNIRWLMDNVETKILMNVIGFFILLFVYNFMLKFFNTNVGPLISFMSTTLGPNEFLSAVTLFALNISYKLKKEVKRVRRYI